MSEIIEEFKKFGEKMYVVAICFVLAIFISMIPSIIMVIYLYGALKSIKNILIQRGNKHLFEFRSKFISAYIISFFGIFLMGVGIFAFVMLLIFTWWKPALFALIPIILGLILLIIGSVFEMKAWENLNVFFKDNRQMFPEHIVSDAIDGADKLRVGNLLMIFSFLVIPGIIGWIFKANGYFKLASLKNLMLQPTRQVVRPQQVMQAEPPKTIIETGKFCPHCGTKIKQGASYCPGCGYALN